MPAGIQDLSNPAQVGRGVGVRAVLTGVVTIDEAGEKITVAITLVDSWTGSLLWSRTWTHVNEFKPPDDLPSWQAKIVREIAETSALKLIGKSPPKENQQNRPAAPTIPGD
jgi:TolB-like protein